MACSNQYIFSETGTPGLNNVTFTVDQYGGYTGGSYYMFKASSGSSTPAYWRVAISGGGALLYVTSTFIDGADELCPNQATWVVGSNGIVSGTGAGPAPTVTTPIDPYAPWGGFANWQRLRLLEYV